jgi:hypothetical protein
MTGTLAWQFGTQIPPKPVKNAKYLAQQSGTGGKHFAPFVAFGPFVFQNFPNQAIPRVETRYSASLPC